MEKKFRGRTIGHWVLRLVPASVIAQPGTPFCARTDSTQERVQYLASCSTKSIVCMSSAVNNNLHYFFIANEWQILLILFFDIYLQMIRLHATFILQNDAMCWCNSALPNALWNQIEVIHATACDCVIQDRTRSWIFNLSSLFQVESSIDSLLHHNKCEWRLVIFRDQWTGLFQLKKMLKKRSTIIARLITNEIIKKNKQPVAAHNPWPLSIDRLQHHHLIRKWEKIVHENLCLFWELKLHRRCLSLSFS